MHSFVSCYRTRRLLNSVTSKMERRSSRVSEAQWNIILDFLERNPSLAKSRGYNNTASGRALSARLWSEVASRLNAEGSGTSKTAKDWSIYVSNYKSKLKKLVAETNVEISGTGGGPAQIESLSSIDSRFLAILGPGFGRSSPRVPVNPFPDTAQPQQPSTSTAVLQTPAHSVEEAEIMGECEVVPHNEPMEVIIESEQHVEPAATVDAEEPVPGSAAPPPTEPVDAEEPVPGSAAPPLPRQSRQTRQRSRPLAPLDEARRILSQIEMQRLRSDAATARALDLIGRNLGRLADAAEAFIQRQ